MASAGDDGAVKVFDTRQKKQVAEFQSKYPMTAVCVGEMGERVFAGGIDNGIKCWNVKANKLEYVMEGHMDTVSR